MRRRNADVPDDRRIQFRIGINLGDIIFDDGDIYGDGVNVAARLEQMADVGGVCVTPAVYEQVFERLEITFEDLGEKSLKNISRPIRVYRVLRGPTPDAARPAAVDRLARRSRGQADHRRAALRQHERRSRAGILRRWADRRHHHGTSRRHELFVISRNSTFVYKGQAVNMREIAQKLGAQYLVEGSVRKSGGQLRVTVQLIDTANRHAHLGRALRPQARRRFRHPGRDHRGDRRHAARPRRGRAAGSAGPQEACEHGGL